MFKSLNLELLVNFSLILLILLCLLVLGMTVNIREMIYGQTPLHYAALNGRRDVITLLLVHGANRLITNNNNMLPYQIAHEQGMISFLFYSIQFNNHLHLIIRSFDY